MLGYYIPYFVAVFNQLLFEAHLRISKKRKIYGLIISLFFVAIVGFRDPSVGKDTYAYVDFFNYLKNGGQMFNPLVSFEPGFYIYVKICTLFLPNGESFLFFTALITYLCIFVFINRYSVFPPLSYLVFIGMFYIPSFNLLREYLGISLGLVAYILIEQKKYRLSFAVIVFAITIHAASAVLFLYYIPFIPNKKVLTKFLLFGSLLILFAKNNVFNLIAYIYPKYAHYVSGHHLFISEGSFSSWFKVGIYFVAASLSYYAYSRSTVPKEKNTCYSFFFYMYVSMFFSILGNSMMMFHRMVFYFGIPLCLAVPKIVFLYFKKEKGIVILIIEILMLALLYLSIKASNNVSTNYITWFFNV